MTTRTIHQAIVLPEGLDEGDMETVMDCVAAILVWGPEGAEVIKLTEDISVQMPPNQLVHASEDMIYHRWVTEWVKAPKPLE